jgi:hypothetical protein
MKDGFLQRTTTVNYVLDWCSVDLQITVSSMDGKTLHRLQLSSSYDSTTIASLVTVGNAHSRVELAARTCHIPLLSARLTDVPTNQKANLERSPLQKQDIVSC